MYSWSEQMKQRSHSHLSHSVSSISLLLLLFHSLTVTCTCYIPPNFNHKNNDNTRSSPTFSSPIPAFPEHRKPFVAVITEQDAVSSRTRMEETLSALSRAVKSKCIDLISIRCVSQKDDWLLEELVYKLVLLRNQMKVKKNDDDDEGDFLIVVNDNVEVAIKSGADGVHIKEKDMDSIPSVRERFGDTKLVIGISVHSVPSAIRAASYGVEYLFVGTCYWTPTHPDKLEVEGPDLPGRIKCALLQVKEEKVPNIFAIGGINSENCLEPIEKGADGVALIRDIMQADDPKEAALALKDGMREHLSLDKKNGRKYVDADEDLV